MYKLDRFVLRSFLRPFLITFFVMVFFLLMQFVWKYVNELVGRGIEWYYIAELLFYTSATVVPLALPLAVLLSSLMVMGSLGENNELAALKSSGISLLRVLRPLIVFIGFLAVGAFFFANNVIPVANFESESLLDNIRNSKPALSIQPGVFFTGIDGYAIKVDEKYGPNQSKLRKVLIYDHSRQAGNTKVVVADSGKMRITEDERFLKITLYDGHFYEEQRPRKRDLQDNFPLVRSAFERNLMRFDLSAFNDQDLNDKSRKESDMLSVRQLTLTADSLKQAFAKRRQEFNSQIKKRYQFEAPKVTPQDSVAPLKDSILANISLPVRRRVVQNAQRLARSTKAYYSNAALEYKWRSQIITRHLLEWQRKFSMSFAVIVLFFIGAPLGAIIRKGGMGLPVVVSVLIFILYHVSNFSFEKLGRYEIWDPFPAMWTANLILLPVGIWLTYKATTDSSLFNVETYLRPFRKIWNLIYRPSRESTVARQ